MSDSSYCHVPESISSCSSTASSSRPLPSSTSSVFTEMVGVPVTTSMTTSTTSASGRQYSQSSEATHTSSHRSPPAVPSALSPSTTTSTSLVPLSLPSTSTSSTSQIITGSSCASHTTASRPSQPPRDCQSEPDRHRENKRECDVNSVAPTHEGGDVEAKGVPHDDQDICLDPDIEDPRLPCVCNATLAQSITEENVCYVSRPFACWRCKCRTPQAHRAFTLLPNNSLIYPISIIGVARQGKSTTLNYIATMASTRHPVQREGQGNGVQVCPPAIFRTSDGMEACTTYIDFAIVPISLPTQNANPAVASYLILLDCEGTGFEGRRSTVTKAMHSLMLRFTNHVTHAISGRLYADDINAIMKSFAARLEHGVVVKRWPNLSMMLCKVELPIIRNQPILRDSELFHRVAKQNASVAYPRYIEALQRIQVTPNYHLTPYNPDIYLPGTHGVNATIYRERMDAYSNHVLDTVLQHPFSLTSVQDPHNQGPNNGLVQHHDPALTPREYIEYVDGFIRSCLIDRPDETISPFQLLLTARVRDASTTLLNQFQDDVKTEIARMTLTGITSHEAKERVYNPAERRMREAIAVHLSSYDEITTPYLPFDEKENGIIITGRRELERTMNEVMTRLQTHFEMLLSRLIAQEREAQERAAKEAEEKRCASLVLEQLNEYVRLRNQDNLRVSSVNDRRRSGDNNLDGGMGSPEQDMWSAVQGRHDRIAAVCLNNYDSIVSSLTRVSQQIKADRRAELAQGLINYSGELRSHYDYWRAIDRTETKTDHVDGQPYIKVVDIQKKNRLIGSKTKVWVAPHVSRTTRTWTVYHLRNGDSFSTPPVPVSTQEVLIGSAYPVN